MCGLVESVFRDRQIGARWARETRPSPLTGVRNRASYGVESGPWIGRVPVGWTATELARVASGPDADFRLVGSEGSILVFPAGVIWLDHGALRSLQLGAVGRINLEVAPANMGSRFDRHALVRLQLGHVWFDAEQAAGERLQQSIQEAELDAQALSANELADAYSWLRLSVLMPSLQGLSNWQQFIQKPFGKVEGFMGDEDSEDSDEVAEVQLSQPGIGLYSATGDLLGLGRFSGVTDIWRDGQWLAINFEAGRVALRADQPDEFEAFVRSRLPGLAGDSD
jgi:hypothetical protein